MIIKFYLTKKSFINDLLNHQFNNEIFDITFQRRTYSMGVFSFTNKSTGVIYYAKFFTLESAGGIIGEIRIKNGSFIIANPAQQGILESNVVSVSASYFISHLENNIVDIKVQDAG
ncbi:hypothetical protein [Mucilaginibacter endophyticus]|uniref:hypothetical protein n=1 Tax=Mucilaginibacter endophyticus TaxID=2675003 RepID=UPI000E0D3900|nr:hypothetical protein [Mucilaginibacter endophyticus]